MEEAVVEERYRGADPFSAISTFADDARRWAEHGYLPVSQIWEQQGDGGALVVVYVRWRAADTGRRQSAASGHPESGGGLRQVGPRSERTSEDRA